MPLLATLIYLCALYLARQENPDALSEPSIIVVMLVCEALSIAKYVKEL